MNKNLIRLTAVFFLAFGAASSFGQAVPDEAKRHYDNGEAAVKARDFETAIKEFEQAIRLAPDWPEAFYDLGLAQEGAKKYEDAVKSYREYLRLAPNAADAEEVKSLINKLEKKNEPGLPIAQGIMGIPWGTDPEQIVRFMNNRGYLERGSTADCLKFRATFTGAPLELRFWIEKRSFVMVELEAMARTPDPQAAYAEFMSKKDELEREYGPPNEQYGGGSEPIWHSRWDLVDKRSSDKYSIIIEYLSSYFSDNITQKQYHVYYLAHAESLSERIKN